MRSVRRNWLLLFLGAFLLFGSVLPAYGAEEIQVLLIKPSIYSGKKGQELSYTLRVNLPQQVEKTYKSFNVTVRFDKRLSLVGQKISEPKQGDWVQFSKANLEGSDTLSMSVNDVKALKNLKALVVKIDLKVKATGTFTNRLDDTYVLSTQRVDGNEDARQEEVSSVVASGLDGKLDVKALQVGDKVLTGSTYGKAKVEIFKDETLLAEGVAKEDGSFRIVINPQKEGTRLRVVAKSTDGKDQEATRSLVVGGEVAATAQEDVVDRGRVEAYVRHGKGMDTSRVTEENRARLGAAVAQGEYLALKKSLTESEEKDWVKEITEAMKAVEAPYMSGYTKTAFGPGKEIKRAEVAQIFRRLLDGGEDRVGHYSSFKDVKDSAWYADAVGFMESARFLSGYEDGTFKPEKAMSRAEFASLMVKILGLNGELSEGPSFSDVKQNHWARGAIGAVQSLGLMKGDDKGRFRPDAKMSRAEACAVINRAYKRNADAEFFANYAVMPFSDVTKKHWAYADIANAAGAY